MDTLLSVQAVAMRWRLSVDKTSKILARHRGQPGFFDFGRPQDDHRRHYSVIRIAPALLEKIEAGMR